MGFQVTTETKTIGGGDPSHDITPADLLKFGLIPEFIGRMPVIANLSELDQEALIRILTEPRNALVKQYRKLFKMDQVELDFTDTALQTIARLAVEQKTGARGLRSILECVMNSIMFDLPDSGAIKCMIEEEVIINSAQPLYVYENEDNHKNKVKSA
jgi:ATP-dependent Clp protease ATP-binding subunit ClpX